MNLLEFDKVFFNTLTEKYPFNTPVPAHIEYYKNKVKSIEIDSKNVYKTFWKTEIRVINTVLQKYKDKKILEIGSGIGQLSIFLKLNGVNIEACEIWDERVSDFKFFCNTFNTEVKIFKDQYQNIDLNLYDGYIAVNIRNKSNNFEKDISLLEAIARDDKFIFLEPFSYEDSEINEKNKIYYKHCMEMQYKFFNC